MKWTFENAPKLIALLSVLLVVLTTVHDWGYFIVIGPQFRSVQTTYDYITNAIEWLPSMAMAIVITWAGSFLTRSFLTRSREQAEGFGDHQFLHWSRRTQSTAILMTLVSLFWFGYGWFETYPSSLATSVGGGVVLACSGFLTAVALRWLKGAVATNLAYLLFATMILTGAFVRGVGEANSAIQSSAPVYKLKLRSGDAKSVVLLRTFEKGVLIWSADTKTAELIRWEQIDGLSHVVAFDNVKSGCRTVSSWFCPPPVEP